MRTKLNRIVAVLAVIGLMAGSSLAYATTGGNSQDNAQCTRQGKGAKFFEEMAKDLKLTPEQKEKLKAQREVHMQQSKAAREQMKTKMEALHELIAKPGTARADVTSLVNEISALKNQMFLQKIDDLFAVKAILTPEQFAQMEAKHKEHMSKMRKHWGHKESKESTAQESQEQPEPPQE